MSEVPLEANTSPFRRKVPQEGRILLKGSQAPFLGPVGFEKAQHRRAPRPSVERKPCFLALPFFFFGPLGPLVLWCFVLNPHRRFRDPKFELKETTIESPATYLGEPRLFVELGAVKRPPFSVQQYVDDPSFPPTFFFLV